MLVVLGAAETGRFAVAFLIAGFLNVIPSTIAQVLFAEASRQGVTLRGQLRKAIRGVYGLLLRQWSSWSRPHRCCSGLFGAAYVRGHGLPAGPGAERAAHRGNLPG